MSLEKLKEQLLKLDESREATINAINSKGGNLSEDAKVSDLANAINELNTVGDLGEIEAILELKADKSDTYTKSEVDALVAEGGGGGGEDNGIVIPAYTYTMEIDGKTYYALNSFSVKECEVNLSGINGFAFQLDCESISFNMKDGDEIIDTIEMEYEQITHRYLIRTVNSGYSIAKSANRKYHTLYIFNNVVTIDSKSIFKHKQAFKGSIVVNSKNGKIKFLNQNSDRHRLSRFYFYQDDDNYYIYDIRGTNIYLVCTINKTSFAEFDFSSEDNSSVLQPNICSTFSTDNGDIVLDYAYWQKPYARPGAKVLVISEDVEKSWRMVRIQEVSERPTMMNPYSHENFYVKIGITGQSVSFHAESDYLVRAVKLKGFKWNEDFSNSSGYYRFDAHNDIHVLDTPISLEDFYHTQDDGIYIAENEVFVDAEVFTSLFDIIELSNTYYSDKLNVLFCDNHFNWKIQQLLQRDVKLLYHSWNICFEYYQKQHRYYVSRSSYKTFRQIPIIIEDHNIGEEIVVSDGNQQLTLKPVALKKKVSVHENRTQRIKWVNLLKTDCYLPAIIETLSSAIVGDGYNRYIRSIIPYSYKRWQEKDKRVLFLEVKFACVAEGNKFITSQILCGRYRVKCGEDDVASVKFIYTGTEPPPVVY